MLQCPAHQDPVPILIHALVDLEIPEMKGYKSSGDQTGYAAAESLLRESSSISFSRPASVQ